MYEGSIARSIFKAINLYFWHIYYWFYSWVYIFLLFQVESFILEQGELDEEPGLDTSKFLLTDGVTETGIDEETQCRLEALLSAGNTFFENGQLDPASPSYAGKFNITFFYFAYILNL